MFKIAAWVQLVFILFLVGFSTYQLFRGRFELALGVLPFLMVYYIFITAKRKKQTSSDSE